MSLFKKKLPPPPNGPEPLYTTRVDKITLVDGREYYISSPQIMPHLDGTIVISGTKVDDKNKPLDSGKTFIQFSEVSRRCRMKWSGWSYHLIESPEDDTWS